METKYLKKREWV